MANYSYNKVGEVKELNTGHILFLTQSKKDSIKITNWLNAGGAFNGWTPYFFLDKKIQKKEYLK